MTELIKTLRWLARVRICETKIVDCNSCEFHGFCTDPDSDESIADQIIAFEQAADALEDAEKRIAELEAKQRWISVEERLPEAETEVFILAKTKSGYTVMTTAMYEDGKMPTEDSVWNWYDLDFDYDEENDVYLIPEGWWEYRHYSPDDVYNCAVDNTVTHWLPLPSPPKDGE